MLFPHALLSFLSCCEVLARLALLGRFHLAFFGSFGSCFCDRYRRRLRRHPGLHFGFILGTFGRRTPFRVEHPAHIGAEQHPHGCWRLQIGKECFWDCTFVRENRIGKFIIFFASFSNFRPSIQTDTIKSTSPSHYCVKASSSLNMSESSRFYVLPAVKLVYGQSSIFLSSPMPFFLGKAGR